MSSILFNPDDAHAAEGTHTAKSVKIGITGLPGSGKTEALEKVIAMLEADQKTVGGMVTKPMFDQHRLVGIYVLDWMTKQKDVLAHIDYESNVSVGRFGVDMKKLEEVGVHAIETAIDKADIIVIDEVGKMEVESPTFVSAVKRALDATKPMLLTLHKKSRNPLLQDIRRRDDVRILEVTPINRNLLPFKIIKLLKEEGG